MGGELGRKWLVLGLFAGATEDRKGVLAVVHGTVCESFLLSVVGWFTSRPIPFSHLSGMFDAYQLFFVPSYPVPSLNRKGFFLKASE